MTIIGWNFIKLLHVSREVDLLRRQLKNLRSQIVDDGDDHRPIHHGSSEQAMPVSGDLNRLVNQVAQGTADERRNAIDAIGHMGSAAASAVPVLVDRLADHRTRVREAATSALVRTGAPAVPSLISALDDESRRVRRRAASILGDLGAAAKDAIPALSRAKQEWGRGDGQAATRALMQIHKSVATGQSAAASSTTL